MGLNSQLVMAEVVMLISFTYLYDDLRDCNVGQEVVQKHIHLVYSTGTGGPGGRRGDGAGLITACPRWLIVFSKKWKVY